MNEFMSRFYQERKTRIENTLIQLENEKCIKCNYWVDKEFINEEKICNKCKPKRGE